jgi:hypothetical protein
MLYGSHIAPELSKANSSVCFAAISNIAAIHGYVDVVKVLLAHGANVNAQNLSHETALDLARQNQQTDVISVLINPPK